MPISSAATSHRWPLLRLAFRPFYLGAAAFGAVAVPLAVAVLLGVVSLPLAPTPLLWHAHEMIFGFAVAAIAGVMLTTAAKAWSPQVAPRGAALAALALLWLGARITALLALPYGLYALLDALLLPLVAAVMFSGLLQPRHRAQLPLGVIVLLLALANGVFHLAVLGVIDLAPLRALHTGLALVVLLECLIAARVIPGYTISGLPGIRLRAPRRFETPTLAVSATALALWVADPARAATAVACAAAALLHALRLWHWQPWRTGARPLLWVLHLAYGWLSIGFALLALAQFGWVDTSAAVHALAVGATAGLIIGMMARTARSHTGRPARASRRETLAFVLAGTAALLRVAAPLCAPRWQPLLLVGAAAAWGAAFVLLLTVLTPWLLAARLDGRDG